MLDDKINGDVAMERVTEDGAQMAAKRAQNREDLIRDQIKHSQLQTANKNTSEELNQLNEKNAVLTKGNADLMAKNKALEEEIADLERRIQLNALLKEVDANDLEELAKSNQEMYRNYKTIMHQWEHIMRLAAETA